MSRTVNITGQEIVIKEQDGQRVVTLNDIDKIHNRPRTQHKIIFIRI